MDKSNMLNGYPICKYLDILIGSPVFKYIVFVESNNKFKALVPISSVVQKYVSTEGDCMSGRLLEWVDKKKDIKEISDVQGFMWDNQVVTRDTLKIECLKMMQKLNIESIPLVENKELIGVVEKSKLLASLIIDVSTEL